MLMRPMVVFSPVIPHQAAGMRTEPPVSVPKAQGTIRAATARCTRTATLAQKLISAGMIVIRRPSRCSSRPGCGESRHPRDSTVCPDAVVAEAVGEPQIDDLCSHFLQLRNRVVVSGEHIGGNPIPLARSDAYEA